MKQATVKLPSGEFCFQEVPDWCEIVEMTFSGNKIVCWSPDMCSGDIDLPPGSYQLHGSDPLNLTEEEAAQVVGEPNALYEYPDYQNNELCLLSTPAASLDSLAGSLGIEKPFVVLKNIEK